MSTLMEKPIRVNRIVTTSGIEARAIEEPTRTKILKILYKKQLTAEQILGELKKTGYNKALTTIRHHLDILKISGLIEVVKIQECRGAIAKFYGTSTKLLEYDTPDDFESKYANLIKNALKVYGNYFQKTVRKQFLVFGKLLEGYRCRLGRYHQRMGYVVQFLAGPA